MYISYIVTFCFKKPHPGLDSWLNYYVISSHKNRTTSKISNEFTFIECLINRKYIYMYLFIYVCIVFSWWDWGLNSQLCAYKAGSIA
jgi:hypothetical protein